MKYSKKRLAKQLGKLLMRVRELEETLPIAIASVRAETQYAHGLISDLSEECEEFAVELKAQGGDIAFLEHTVANLSDDIYASCQQGEPCGDPPTCPDPVGCDHDPIEGDDIRARGIGERLQREMRDVWDNEALKGPDVALAQQRAAKIAENDARYGSLGPNAFEFPL